MWVFEIWTLVSVLSLTQELSFQTLENPLFYSCDITKIRSFNIYSHLLKLCLASCKVSVTLTYRRQTFAIVLSFLFLISAGIDAVLIAYHGFCYCALPAYFWTFSQKQKWTASLSKCLGGSNIILNSIFLFSCTWIFLSKNTLLFIPILRLILLLLLS